VIGAAAAAMALGIVLLLAACDEEPAVVGPDPSTAALTCLGVAQPKCDELGRQALTELAIPTFRSIRVTCTRLPCTERSGEVTIDVIDATGRQLSTGQAWATLGEIGDPVPVAS
jgi:hypothetical protein